MSPARERVDVPCFPVPVRPRQLAILISAYACGYFAWSRCQIERRLVLLFRQRAQNATPRATTLGPTNAAIGQQKANSPRTSVLPPSTTAPVLTEFRSWFFLRDFLLFIIIQLQLPVGVELPMANSMTRESWPPNSLSCKGLKVGLPIVLG